MSDEDLIAETRAKYLSEREAARSAWSVNMRHAHDDNADLFAALADALEESDTKFRVLKARTTELLTTYIAERNAAIFGDRSGPTLRDSWQEANTDAHDLAVEAMVLSLFRSAVNQVEAK